MKKKRAMPLEEALKLFQEVEGPSLYDGKDRRLVRKLCSERLSKFEQLRGGTTATLPNCSITRTSLYDVDCMESEKVICFEKNKDVYEACKKRLPGAKMALSTMMGKPVEVILHNEPLLHPLPLLKTGNGWSTRQTWFGYMKSNNVRLLDYDGESWKDFFLFPNRVKKTYDINEIGSVTQRVLTEFNVLMGLLGFDYDNYDSTYITYKTPTERRFCAVRFFTMSRSLNMLRSSMDNVIELFKLGGSVADYYESPYTKTMGGGTALYCQWIFKGK